MGKLHTRMDEEMVLRGLGPKSRQIYLAAVRKFIEFHGRSPGVLGKEEIRAYVIYLPQERKLSRSSVNKALCAIKFFCRLVLDCGEEIDDLRVRRHRGKKLAVILTRGEIGRLLAATENRIYRTLFMRLYAAGCASGKGAGFKSGTFPRPAPVPPCRGADSALPPARPTGRLRLDPHQRSLRQPTPGRNAAALPAAAEGAAARRRHSFRRRVAVSGLSEVWRRHSQNRGPDRRFLAALGRQPEGEFHRERAPEAVPGVPLAEA